MTLRNRLAKLTIVRWSLGDRWQAVHPPARGGADWGLTFPGRAYCEVFDRAFPDVQKNPWKVTAKSCATFFRRISDSDLEAIRRFIEAIRPCVLIKDLTDGSVALGFRARKSGNGGLERTELGQLMRGAKPYNDRPSERHRRAGRELALRMCSLVSAVPSYRNIDAFVAAPPSDPAKKFSLPRGFAAKLAGHTGKSDLSNAVSKSKATRALKNLPWDEKVDALIGSVAVDKAKVSGKSIVVVDDLYQSGLTINYIAEELRAAGAKEVFGLAAVKTLRNDDNVPKTAALSQVDDDVNDEDLF